ncbi:hemolysin family protein [Myxococcota bacterium]|nr:hemolysin family protein [Myxococcota bacterium]MBU1433053.1 hemolysin family protein [Myxococcota bacterium]MBU1898076.1 hemolysin family protein [Myxococcota bacterium]
MIDIYFFFYLLLQSAFFSGAETSLFSIGKPARVRLEQGDRADRRIAHLLSNPRDLLITILFGNELTNIAISIVAASITSRLFDGFSLLWKTLLSTGVVLPLLILFGEVTPKTLAARQGERFARLIVWPLSVFNALIRPIRRALRLITDALLRARAQERDNIDEGEFRTLIDAGAREGVVEEQERELIHNVLDFGDQTLSGVMRPFDEVFSVEVNRPTPEVIAEAAKRHHSRIPVWEGDPRTIIGAVHTKDLLAIRWGVRPAAPLRRLLRKVVFTTRAKSAADLLDEFRRRRIHIAIVVDEFGHAVGLCTMEDLLEELFGPITDDPQAVSMGMELE